MTALLTIEGLRKQRPDEPDRSLFSDMTAEIAAGDRVALLGGSGQGKSTLLRIIALLEAADGGRLLLGGKEPRAYAEPKEWRRQACYVAQQPVMLPGSVEDNLRAASGLHGTPFDEALARRLMDAVGLADIGWRRAAADLSGGEKQRTALVRALLLKPRLLLLDEVTASLDPGSKDAVEALLDTWSAREGAACLWVTHDLDQAERQCRTVWFMAEGRLLEVAEADVFFRGPATEQGRRFVRPDAEGRTAGRAEAAADKKPAASLGAGSEGGARA
ncbi:ABC transporter ATP-binding protein [Paenibacillus methanolicus]|uniref:Putative ABC transport system ATP-binding protein n=1 Tax=Paenibacillus methanolicus TaxID=582686 RepID=A0A5S5BV88_9BACL|nr:ATP-binding cassette domain-containing protein [Paenibacillus methanolicus]TYP70226.1 putative ABC transport system ATP-binding protein [Paenibacillus methanolicus]